MRLGRLENFGVECLETILTETQSIGKTTPVVKGIMKKNSH